jgi:hypothetical protein
MKKDVIFEDEQFLVSLRDYGFNSKKFIINGEDSSVNCDSELLSMESFKEKTKLAIIEYKNRLDAWKTFKEWDGRL